MTNQLFQAWQASNGLMDTGTMRPYFNSKGQAVVALKDGQGNYREQMVTNALLRKYEWEQIDAAVLEVTRLPNVALNDFLRLGLTVPLDGLGVITSVYEQLGDMTEATVAMEGTVKGEHDKVDYNPQTIPVPLIFKDFSITLRMLEASRRGTTNSRIETDHARTATRKVQDKIDDLIFNGTSNAQLAGNVIYGLTNKPQRITKTAAQCGGGDFGTAGNPFKTINGAIAFLQAAGFNGPYGCYLARTQYGQVNQLIANTAITERTAVLSQIPGLNFLSPADKLTDGYMVVWQLTPDVADLAIAQDITAVQWDGSMGMWSTEFRVFSALTIRVKHDANDACGVIYVSAC